MDIEDARRDIAKRAVFGLFPYSVDDFEGLVRSERGRQDKKWGVQDHDPNYWMVILMEEVGEAAQTLWGETVELDKLEKELVQIAAVAKAMWESGKRQGWL